MSYGRSIQVAFDKLSGEILKADDVFELTKDAFAIRKQFHMDEVDLSCCECDQKLYVSTSKYDRLHFKHGPNAEYCFLKDSNLSPEDKEKFSQIYHGKESARHHDLKNKIGKALIAMPGIVPNSVAIDNRFIVKGNEKRRPDVYCKFGDKELVFEIQLSNLSLRYILNRYFFYKKHGIYLIWILDNFDIHDQGQLERDIKYLTKFENFFKLDETADSFKLQCEYKFPFLTKDNKLLTKWMQKSVSLNQIKFDTDHYQIYYYNLDQGRNATKENQRQKIAAIEEQLRKKKEAEKYQNACGIVEEIIENIRDLKTRGVLYYVPVVKAIDDLALFEANVLNEKLALIGKKTPAVTEWILNASNSDNSFLDFILHCEKIKLDVNETTSDGLTAFQAIYKNADIHKYVVTKAILERGYVFTESDQSLVEAIKNTEEDGIYKAALFGVIKRNTNRQLINAIYDHGKLILILESARLHTITGFKYKPDQWIAFANNAIEYHSEYWEYIESAFKQYGLWDMLLQIDRKQSFHKKVTEFYKKMPSQKYDFEAVYCELFTELAF